MTNLQLKLDDIDFEQLLELGRAVIPTIATAWTDHNTHDPGIMLTELVAWIADAQVYSIGRLRRDERLAYARLIGLQPTGPSPARGLIWPRPGVAPGWPAGTVIDRTRRVTGSIADMPSFRPSQPIELTTAALTSVRSIASGVSRDWTSTNDRREATFLPFGEVASAGDRLTLGFEGTLATAVPASPISIGFEVLPDAAVSGTATDAPTRPRSRRLRARVADGDGEREIVIVDDSTDGLLRSGVVLIHIPEDRRPRDQRVAVVIESRSGALLRAPRIRRIAVNVIAVEQVESIVEDLNAFGQGLPNQRIELARTGLLSPPTLKVTLGGQQWESKGDLLNSNPGDRHFTFDQEKNRLAFGNDLNGRAPDPGAPIRLEYEVCDGARGNLTRDLEWTIQGIAGLFGTNSEVMSGGADARPLNELRGAARARVRDTHPLVTSQDLTDAAKQFTDLGVRRAQEPGGDITRRRPAGTRTLVVVGPRDPKATSSLLVESREWLEEIRRRLAPRLPLGHRLEVVAPRDVTVRVTARLVAAPNVDPDAVKAAAEEILRNQFAAVAVEPGGSEWPLGRDVTRLAVMGRLRKAAGVARIVEVQVRADDQDPAEEIVIGPIGLARLVLDPSDIVVERHPQRPSR